MQKQQGGMATGFCSAFRRRRQLFILHDRPEQREGGFSNRDAQRCVLEFYVWKIMFSICICEHVFRLCCARDMGVRLRALAGKCICHSNASRTRLHANVWCSIRPRRMAHLSVSPVKPVLLSSPVQCFLMCFLMNLNEAVLPYARVLDFRCHIARICRGVKQARAPLMKFQASLSKV